MRLFHTTIFCPSCGLANRDDADVCTECGSVIPKLEDTFSLKKSSPSPKDFGIVEDTNELQNYPPPPPPPSKSASSAYPPYDQSGFRQAGNKIVCETCGTVLNSTDRQCSGCGKPFNQQNFTPKPAPTSPQPLQSYPSRPITSSSNKESIPPQSPSAYPYSTKPMVKIPTNAAKCAKCGAIVYDYETRCSNCNRILSSPTPAATPTPPQPPPGTARCGRCNTIVYSHQTVCPKCGKALAPAYPVNAPGQKVSRCRRCGQLVYPTDTVCPNCNKVLDPI